MTQQPPIIRLEGVSKVFDGEAVLDKVDLAIQPGATTVVIGPSGCGKSVLLKHIVGLLKPDSGKVFFCSPNFKGGREQEISAMSDRRLTEIRRHMGFLFQGSALFDSMTVEENVDFPLAEHDVDDPGRRAERCREVLALVGLDGAQRKYPEELSGGQKKRVALARAIALGPEVILYDEPTTGLDPIRADLINELILKLQRALGTTAVVVTHDMHSACKVGDRIIMLHEGRFIVDSTPAGLDNVDNQIVARFVKGLASEDELAELESGRFANSAPGEGKGQKTQ